MAEVSESSGKIAGYILTGLVSLVVAVGGGWVLNYLTEKRSALEYQVVNSETFSGEHQNIAISTINIRNSGKKELENVFTRISYTNAVITESKIAGIPKSEVKPVQNSCDFQLTVPFLNPDETISIQLLLKIPAGAYQNPAIEVRGKGVAGKDITKEKKGVASKSTTLWSLVPTALFAIFPMFILLTKLNPRLGYTKKHRDDQRDVIAYILDVNGFFAESANVRNTVRNVSYWSEVDHLTQQWINSEDATIIRKGIKALEDLIEYAAIADTSTLLVCYNIARLAISLNDVEKAKQSLELALKGKHKVILKRVNLDERLSQLYNPS